MSNKSKVKTTRGAQPGAHAQLQGPLTLLPRGPSRPLNVIFDPSNVIFDPSIRDPTPANSPDDSPANSPDDSSDE